MLRLHSMPTCRKLMAWTMLQVRVHQVRSSLHRANVPLLRIHILTIHLLIYKNLSSCCISTTCDIGHDQRPTLPSYASGRSDYCVRDSSPPLVPQGQRDSEENPTRLPQQDDQAIVENTTMNAYPRHSSVTATRGSPAGRLSGTGENTSTRKE